MTGVLDDVRRIVHALVPPVLDALGLEGAVAAAGGGVLLRRVRRTPPRLEVAVLTHSPLGELPAGVELAAYRIGSEALTNVTKHA